MALILFGVLFLGVSDTQLVAPLLPLIAQDLGTTPGHAGIIVTTYSLAAAAFALIASSSMGRTGTRKCRPLLRVTFDFCSMAFIFDAVLARYLVGGSPFGGVPC